jgi:PAS domain S-box-containing protein
MESKSKDNYLKKELYELIKTDERIFDFIQDSSLDGLWYWDIENPENEWMNAKFWTVLGYDPEEMPHKSGAWQGIINQDDLKIAMKNFTKHCENPNHAYDQVVRYTHKNGSTIWIRCRGLAIRDNDGKPLRMLGAHHDITELKDAENELNRFFDLVPDMIAIASVDGYFKRLNRAWEKVLGFSIQELQSKPFKEFIHHDDIEPTFKEIEKQLNKKSTVNFTNRYRCKNGDYKWLYWVAIPSPDGKYLYAASHDITDQKQIETELVEAKENAEASERKLQAINKELEIFKAISDNAVFGKAIADLKGNIIYINKFFATIHGYTPEELTGKNISLFYSQKQEEKVGRLNENIQFHSLIWYGKNLRIYNFRSYRLQKPNQACCRIWSASHLLLFEVVVPLVFAW